MDDAEKDWFFMTMIKPDILVERAENLEAILIANEGSIVVDRLYSQLKKYIIAAKNREISEPMIMPTSPDFLEGYTREFRGLDSAYSKFLNALEGKYL